jgi:hypothetical protein
MGIIRFKICHLAVTQKLKIATMIAEYIYYFNINAQLVVRITIIRHAISGVNELVCVTQL